MAETVQQLVRALADSDSTGLAFGSDSWTWAETVGDAAARARVLRSWADPDRPLHVGVLMENTPEMIRTLLAGAIGAHVTAGINATRRGESLAADVRRADCQVLLTDTEHLPLLDGLDLGGARIIDTDSDEWSELVAEAPRDIDGFAEVGAMDTFMLIFTSGTSGEPKAVQVSNFMVVMSGSVLAEKYALTPDDVCYCAMPLFHS
uniref:AMP-binding protein n=1 Tax=Aeromicrobium sp. TaxID=1871063 RepID=UPI002FC8CA1F